MDNKVIARKYALKKNGLLLIFVSLSIWMGCKMTRIQYVDEADQAVDQASIAFDKQKQERMESEVRKCQEYSRMRFTIL